MALSKEEKEALILKVDQALNDIRPYLEADGGDMKVVDITEDMIVKLELLGNCGSCQMAGMTLKAGVEETILRAVPEIIKIEAVNMMPIKN